MARSSRQLDPTVVVIFGASGDLAWRKLIPALTNLGLDRRLPEKLAIVGVARSAMTDDAFRAHLREGVDRFSRRGKPDPATWDAFAANVSYLSGEYGEPGVYERLALRVSELEKAWGTPPDRLFYMSTPPTLVAPVAERLAAVRLTQDIERARVVVEKPFGRDLESALELNRALWRHLDERQIYRIDHFLGKETVQNILALRFANSLFEPVWNRRYIDHVQITVAEQVGLENRGGYYDKFGALRDMIQNHLIQVLCFVAMECPVSFDAQEIRSKKVDVLRALRPIPPERVPHYAVRGQYGAGWLRGEKLPAYRGEAGVPAGSNTETFAALKLYVDNWRWNGVPFYLRTGKRMPGRVSEVVVQFHEVPHQTFPPSASADLQPNRLVIRIQPNEGITLSLQAKEPGTVMRLRTVDMRFCYSEAFKAPQPEAYETLLADVINDDATSFIRADQVEAAWRIVTPVLDYWEANPATDFPNYPANSWGPEAATSLLARDERNWSVPQLRDDAGEE
ncbi:MAG TPA: glucose-6-phosphate dehydrogenase [Phycisphaerae bacterium]|nr:glucose-6-phosphate dehydrogenase [Phycisphaerae bacterium]